MPGAGNAKPVELSFTQRPAIVRADIVQGIELPADVKQHHQPINDLDNQLAGVGNLGRVGDANEVGHGDGAERGVVGSKRLTIKSLRAVRLAIRDSVVFSNAATDGFAHRVADTFDRDTVEYLLKEAGHDHADGFLARQAATASVKDLLVIDSPRRRAVSAAYVVGFDLEAGDRIGTRVLGEHQVIVALIAVGLLRAFVDLDHAAPNDA